MTAGQESQQDPSREEISEIRELTGVVEDLIKMMSDGNIKSLKLNFGSLRLNLESGKPAQANGEPRSQDTYPVRHQAAVSAPTGDDGSKHTIAAPMIGTFYVAPAPNEPPFVETGDEVVEGQTIGIIEAMKIMNEIAADRSGTVIDVIAGDGQTVEYGSPLLLIEPSQE